eukprot:COSAG01_NODE_20502_length_950_cov_0.829612_1_plen_190_part_00
MVLARPSRRPWPWLIMIRTLAGLTSAGELAMPDGRASQHRESHHVGWGSGPMDSWLAELISGVIANARALEMLMCSLLPCLRRRPAMQARLCRAALAPTSGPPLAVGSVRQTTVRRCFLGSSTCPCPAELALPLPLPLHAAVMSSRGWVPDPQRCPDSARRSPLRYAGDAPDAQELSGVRARPPSSHSF